MRSLALVTVFVLSLFVGDSQEGFPKLGVPQHEAFLERVVESQVSLREALNTFDKHVHSRQEPRIVLLYSRALFLMLLRFESDLSQRYADREHAPVPITAQEAEALKSFIYQLMVLRAKLLALEEEALQRVLQTYPEFAHQGIGERWHPYIERGRAWLQRPSVRTGLALSQLPTVCWDEIDSLKKELRKTLKGCDWKCLPPDFIAEIKLPLPYNRFAAAPLPWDKE